MALVPRYHPLRGQRNNSLLAQCAPNSPRDAWTWLSENPKLAAKSGLTSCIANSPGQSCQVLYVTTQQYSHIKNQNTLCVLCSWDANFQTWQTNQHIVLEQNLDNRQHYRLVNMRELISEQEVIDVHQQTQADGLVLLSEDEPAVGASGGGDALLSTQNGFLSTQTSPIPIPPRGHMRHRSQMIEPNAVLITLTRLENSNSESGFY